MAKLIEAFVRTLSGQRSRQILSILNGLKDTGEVRSLEEYRLRLTELTRILTSTNVATPSLQPEIVNSNALVSSHGQQVMKEHTLEDLRTSFRSLDTISSLLDAQDEVMKGDYLLRLRNGLDALEQLIEKLEWIQFNKLSGYSRGTYYNFKNPVVPIVSSVSSVPFLMQDHRAGVDLPITSSCVASPLDDKLSLPLERFQDVLPSIVQKLDISTGSTSDIDVSFPGNDLQNLLGSSTGRYWIHQVLLDTPSEASPVLYLEFIFDSYVPINSIAIEPATSTGLFLENVDVYTYGNTAVNVFAGSTFFKQNSKIYFPAVSVRKVIMKFKQTAYTRLEYRYRPETGSYSLLVDPLHSSALEMSEMASDVRSIVSSAALRGLVGLTTGSRQTVYKYSYQFGFDNIRFGSASYREEGLFSGDKVVSETPVYSLASSLSLFETDKFNAEVSCLKINYDSEGNTISTQIVEVPNIDDLEITHERFFLVGGSSGQTRFFPDYTNGNVVVYKDGTPLISSEFETSVDEGATWTLGDTPAGTPTEPQRYLIRPVSPDVSSIYTASYTVRTSPPSLATKYFLNSDLSAYIGPKGTVEFLEGQNGVTIHSCELYPKLILRQNNRRDNSITGGVKTFRFLVGDSDNVAE